MSTRDYMYTVHVRMNVAWCLEFRIGSLFQNVNILQSLPLFSTSLQSHLQQHLAETSYSQLLYRPFWWKIDVDADFKQEMQWLRSLQTDRYVRRLSSVNKLRWGPGGIWCGDQHSWSVCMTGLVTKLHINCACVCVCIMEGCAWG